MSHLSILTRAEIEGLGPPTPDELADTNVPEAFLRDLTLKHVAALLEPTTISVAERLHLPRALCDELLYHLYREKLIEIRLQSAVGVTHYAMLEHGWERIARLHLQSGYVGPAPVSLADYAHMIRLQAVPLRPASMETIREAFSDLVLPESLLHTLGCVINSRSSLFLTGPPGSGKTALSERMNSALSGAIWVPHAIEVDGKVIRIFDAQCHHAAPEPDSMVEYDRRWVRIERPLIIVGGELTLNDTDISWSDTTKIYEAPIQVKANGGTLVIDDFGRQRVTPLDLLNRWIMPLERRVDFLTLNGGKKIQVPFEELVVFSTNLDEKTLVDEAFLRRMGYRARLEPPTTAAYIEIFKRAASALRLTADDSCLEHVIRKYEAENRPMKSCEPRDLLGRVADICRFEGRPRQLTLELVDQGWRNYFGVPHSFEFGMEWHAEQAEAQAV